MPEIGADRHPKNGNPAVAEKLRGLEAKFERLDVNSIKSSVGLNVLLRKYGCDTSLWGLQPGTETLESLWHEIKRGKGTYVHF